jgi:hypothetical protein
VIAVRAALRYGAMLFACLYLGELAQAADLPIQVHGSADTYSAPGLALAWGILRGADESKTIVVVRVVTDPSVYKMAAVAGIDPFTERRKDQLKATAVEGGLDVRLPRPSFGDLPRTEFRFFRSAEEAKAGAPQLVVYYLGVPDTTPEFAEPAALDTYLAGRIDRARTQKGSP